MQCRDVRELAESFVTEQLLVETNHAIVAHLSRCAPCRAEVDGLRRLRSATRTALASSPALRPRPELLSELTSRLRAEAERQRPAAVRSRKWLAVAAILLVIAGAGLVVRGWSAAVFAEILHAAAGDHQFCALTFKLPESPISLEEAARRYDDVVNTALAAIEPTVTELSGGPLVIEERHSCVFEGRRFAHIVLRYKRQLVSVLVSDDEGTIAALWTTGPSATTTLETLPATDGFQVASFRAQRHLVFVVSSLNDHDVRAVAETVLGPLSRALGV